MTQEEGPDWRVTKVWSEEKQSDGILHYVEAKGYAKEKIIKLVDELEAEEWRLRLSHSALAPELYPGALPIKETHEDEE